MPGSFSSQEVHSTSCESRARARDLPGPYDARLEKQWSRSAVGGRRDCRGMRGEPTI